MILKTPGLERAVLRMFRLFHWSDRLGATDLATVTNCQSITKFDRRVESPFDPLCC